MTRFLEVGISTPSPSASLVSMRSACVVAFATEVVDWRGPSIEVRAAVATETREARPVDAAMQDAAVSAAVAEAGRGRGEGSLRRRSGADGGGCGTSSVLDTLISSGSTSL